MLGAIIGDIVGSAYEFHPTNDYNFDLFPPGASFTDDTVCTIAIADALLRDRDFGTSLHEWCRRYPNPKGGYGGRFAQWVRSDNPKPYGSFGNGSAMRVSPIGWWSNNPTELLSLSRKSAEPTHNHELGIDGAQAVAAAIMDCRMNFGLEKYAITPENILFEGIQHALQILGYGLYVDKFELNLDDYRNKFDETCQGTVPVALYIVMTSSSFEDAIRRAVSLGADADTLGAIVGSIAEAIWGIPEWMKTKALSYLPEDMKDVVTEFRDRLRKLKKLTQKCQYYKYGQFRCPDDNHSTAYETEYRWAHDVAHSYAEVQKTKTEMESLASLDWWQHWADTYYLPVSLVGYLFKASMPNYKMTKINQKRFQKFLLENYSQRLPLAKEKLAEKEKLEQMRAIMLWKLGLGNMARLLNGEDPMPSKTKAATAGSWNTQPMPTSHVSTLATAIHLSVRDIAILQQGHIPDAMEDHWFMYCTDDHIRYYRSWTGIAMFDAKYEATDTGYVITSIVMNHDLMEFGVCGDMVGLALFQYLIAAETGHHPGSAWEHYIRVLQIYNSK